MVRDDSDQVAKAEEEMRYGTTPKRTLVKTLIYRVWVILTSYLVIVLTGQTWTQALLPTIILNVLWSISYYNYDRLWQRIEWGIEPMGETVFKKTKTRNKR